MNSTEEVDFPRDTRLVAVMMPRRPLLGWLADPSNLIPLLLFCEGVLFEWNYNRLDQLRSLLPLSLVYSYVIPASYLLVPLVWAYGHQRKRRTSIERKYVMIGVWLTIAMVAILVVQQIARPPGMTTPGWRAYLAFITWPLWIRFGLWFGSDDYRAKKVLHRLAQMSVAASLVSLLLEAAGVSPAAIGGPMHWSYRMIVMFGLFYYLARLLTHEGLPGRSLFAFACCSAEVLGSFKKSLVLGTIVGIVMFAVAFVSLGTNKRARFLRIFSVRTIGLLILLAIMVVAFSGQIGGYLDTTVRATWTGNVGVPLSDMLKPNGQLLDQLSTDRFSMWKTLTPRIWESPWIGSGLDPFYKGAIVTHEGFLDLALSFGFLGVFVFATGMTLWIIALWRSRPPRNILAFQLACFSYIWALLGMNIGISVWVQFSTVNAYFLLIGGISLGLALQRRESGVLLPASSARVPTTTQPQSSQALKNWSTRPPEAGIAHRRVD